MVAASIEAMDSRLETDSATDTCSNSSNNKVVRGELNSNNSSKCCLAAMAEVMADMDITVFPTINCVNAKLL